MRNESEKRSNHVLKRIGRYLLKRLEIPLPSYEQRIINNMQNLYREIRPGDVLLVEGRSKLSQIIQIITKSAWSHAAIYLANRLDHSTDDGVQSILNGLGETERQHMLIEADAGNGVIAVSLSKYQDYNIRICRPFGISPQDLEVVMGDAVGNLGNHYDHENLTDLVLLLLPSFFNPFKKRTIQACLGGCTEYKVICSGMIANAFQKVGYPIVPALLPASDVDNHLINDPYGSKLIMRHYSQIVPRDFDLSPNFEIVKYNIIGLGGFDYKSIWAKE
ncbi:YiiX/YebB-like N1pC/P60 family cysteine hydrolase [Desulfosarcina sp.]|uniref:YiiX/YebB-like N1pC/P60 family cysteine hydrolase n=1 Tax=Desulfosarcina sp. TaxID=2027861 RepID=UPI0029B6E7B4|nr:YiiX/YebB-like N1pC/P60 family cysteine hydrolase [Desulfosarcina sp.]MDX2451058.1 YiiX/YebB-like N1pC/P60 family cysteine hydrolase [Desulfosarcina sp.]MDX2488885.1 YiiX/YebB-like N1pC/P60 family cysteine hydrolase [Desulfosarcina sp.]